ncbi:MAG: hypothetical protein F6K55_18125 [Moorea sp. SIO4A3]|nr:hypothetical protein [Moorena sp. SIO4A3]
MYNQSTLPPPIYTVHFLTEDEFKENKEEYDTEIEELGSYPKTCVNRNALFELQFHTEHHPQNSPDVNITNIGPMPGFKDQFPLQAGWDFKINTPDDVTSAGITNLSDCPIIVSTVEHDQLHLWSGFKDKSARAITHNTNPELSNGHFVTKTVFYYDEPSEDTLLGSLTTIDGEKFPALGGAVWVDIMIMPESIRAPHWHMTEAESGFCYQGYGLVGAIVDGKTIPLKDGGFVEDNLVEEMFIHPNEIFLFPTGAQHYLRNIGNEPFKCIILLRKGVPLNPNKLTAISLLNILGNTPLGTVGPFTYQRVLPMYTMDPESDITAWATSLSSTPNNAFTSQTAAYKGYTINSEEADCSTTSWMLHTPICED